MPPFQINPMPEQLSEDLRSNARVIDTATIGHFREYGFADPRIQGLIPGVRVAGTAVTVMAPGDDGTAISYIVSRLRPGDILVIDRSGHAQACWGEILTRAATVRGITGVVIDGYITDRHAIAEAGLPVWSLGPAPLTTKLRGRGGSINRPVDCGGAVVHPGDLVLADDNGVAFLSPGEALSVIQHASGLQSREAEILARLDAGESLADISGVTELIERKNSDDQADQ